MRLWILLLALMWGGLSGWHGHTQDPRPTLPPTWTPTFTPTATDTPTPTLTPTITPTLTRQQACDAFTVLDVSGGQRYYPYDSAFTLLFATELNNVTAAFIAEHRIGQEGVMLPGITRVATNGINLPIAALPRHGVYDWRLQLLDASERVLCERSGVFVAGFPVTATPTPTLSPNVTVITTTPQVIVVTATPPASD
jgi:hypothetical protein